MEGPQPTLEDLQPTLEDPQSMMEDLQPTLEDPQEHNTQCRAAILSGRHV